jgi:hypothetical protein
MTKRTRTATITLVDGYGPAFTGAVIIGAGNGSDSGMDLYISHDGGVGWVNTGMIAEIVYDACGNCGRRVVEDGYPVHGDIWHLDCATSH